MKSRPILFSGPMVQAILDGRKTMTRRVIKPQPPSGCDYEINGAKSHAICRDLSRTAFVPPTPRSVDHRLPCPYGQPGDRLYVKETWAPIPEMKPAGYFTDPKWVNRTAWYAVDNDRPTWSGEKWRSPIFMPRWASRITLEVTDVRVERVQDIKCHDIRKEGFDCPKHDFPGGFCCSECVALRNEFLSTWNNLNAKRGFGWDSNPWVWCVSFRRVADV